MKAAVLLLAAGGSRRMGSQKLLMEWGASTVVGQALAVALAAPAGEVIVVTGSEAAAVEAACLRAPSAEATIRFRPVHNPRWTEGMLTSIQAGLSEVPSWAEAFFVALGDMPLVEPSVYAHLMATWQPGQIAVPTWEGQRGHPVLVPMSLANEIATLPPADIGLRELLRDHADRVVERPVHCPGIRIDLDTPELYHHHAPHHPAT